MRLERGAQPVGVDARRRGSPRPSSRGRAARRAPRRRRGTRRARASRRSPRSPSCGAFSRALPARREAQSASAIASISTSAPDGSFATSTVERAGGVSPTCARVDLVHRRRSRRGSAGRRSSSRAGRATSRPPRGSRAGSRRPARSAPRSRRRRAPSRPARSASWPDTNTKPFALIACEYGAPWNGAGAASVRTTSLRHCSPPYGGPARLAERGAERLEDRLEHVLGVLALEQAHVHVEPGAVGELLEEARDDVGREPADALAREVDVRDDERPLRDLDDDAGERLVGRQVRPAATRRAAGAQRLARARRRARGRRPRPPRRRCRARPRASAAAAPQRASSPTRWSSTGSPVATLAAALGRQLDAHAGLRPAMA